MNAKVILASLYIAWDRPEEAARAWRALSDDAPGNPTFHFEAAKAFLTANDSHAAARELERFLLISPKNPDILRTLGSIYMDLNELHKAVYKLKKAGTPDAEHLAAICHLRLGMNHEALTELEAIQGDVDKGALGDDPKHIQAYQLTLAEALEKNGRVADAYPILEQALRKDPENDTVLNFIGYVLADHNKDLDRAELLIDTAISRKPDCGAYLDSKAWVLHRKGKDSEALLWIQKAIENIDGALDPVVADHAGDIHCALGDTQLALDFWRFAAENPSPDLKLNETLAKIRRLEPAYQPNQRK